jgi:hypothetical protein
MLAARRRRARKMAGNGAGLRLAFVVNARVPFAYDGLWTAELT